jgi:hypothetical protein
MVERRRWQCPRCGRRFDIPRSAADPTQCLKCEQPNAAPSIHATGEREFQEFFVRLAGDAELRTSQQNNPAAETAREAKTPTKAAPCPVPPLPSDFPTTDSVPVLSRVGHPKRTQQKRLAATVAIAAVASLLALLGLTALPRWPTDSTVAKPDRRQGAPQKQNEGPKAALERGAAPVNAPVPVPRSPAGNVVVHEQAKPHPQLAVPPAAPDRAPNEAELHKRVRVFRGKGGDSETPLFAVDDDWELRWEFRHKLLWLSVSRLNEYVTLDQIAALVSNKGDPGMGDLNFNFPRLGPSETEKIERAVKKWKLPAPDVPGVAGDRDQWKWDRIRPWLEAKTRRKFPEMIYNLNSSPQMFVDEQGALSRVGRLNFAHGGKYVITFAPWPGNEGPWKIEIEQLSNRIE